MSQPKDQQHATMFYSEGQTTAVLVERHRAGRRVSPREFASAGAALDWCQANRVCFVWLPAGHLNPLLN
jgi:hypothetical protein